MLMAEIKITMAVDEDIPEVELELLCDEVEVFTGKLGILCKEFDNQNPAINIKLED